MRIKKQILRMIRLAKIVIVSRWVAFPKKKYSKKTELSFIHSNEILSKYHRKPMGKSICQNEINKQRDINLQIIIPTYNAEKYLKECIDSIINQKTKYKFKAIIVDDGSTDRTPEIADTYKTDSRVIVIHQENKGVASARNTAMRELFADYIMFVDSDDILYDGAIENLLDIAYKENANIVQGDYIYVYNDRKDIGDTRVGATKKVSPVLGNLEGFVWGKVYKSELFKNLSFPEGYWFEDTMLSFLIYSKEKEAFVFSGIVYGYRQENESSLTNSFQGKPRSLESVYITALLIQEHDIIKLPIDTPYIEKIFRQILLNEYIINDAPDEIKEAAFVYIRQVIMNYLPENIHSIIYKDIIRSIIDGDYGIYRNIVKRVL